MANKQVYWPRSGQWKNTMPVKTAILDILRGSETPLKVEQIHKALAIEISLRSIRRYLQQLHQAGLIEFQGAYKARHYKISSQANNSTNSDIKYSIFSPFSLNILQSIQAPLYQREPCAYNLNWLLAYMPNQSYYLSTQQRQQLQAYGRQDSELQIAGTYIYKIYDRLLIDLSYNSSRLEGNTYSLADTKNLLLYGKGAVHKLDSEKIMLLNHKEAIRFLVENNKKITLNIDTFGTLHYLLADDLVLPEYSGRVRTDSVKVSASVYIPIDNPRKLEEILHTIANKAQQILDPFEQSIFLLIHLSYLQAYIDVNKRLARLTANIPLIQNNLIPISFNDVSIDDYRAAMIAIYEINQPQPLTELYTWSYIRTAKEYTIATNDLNIDELRIKYRTQRRLLLRDIVKSGVTHNIEEYIQAYAQQNDVSVHEQEKFMHDCLADLQHLDHSNILGLGITKEELSTWRNSLLDF